MHARSLLPAFALFSLLALACNKHEGDIPLHVTNAPACSAGHEMSKQVVIRMEHGSDFTQFGLDARMYAVNTWAGRKAKVKVALCPKASNCPSPSWIRTTEVTVGGDDSGLTLELPHFEVPCDDGTSASN
jgi:hypothetical protein